MKFLLMALLIIGCCPCKEITVDYFQQEKNRYRELLGKGEITYCEYNELLIGAYELKNKNNLILKK